MPDLGGDGVAFEAPKDFEGEGDRMAGGTSGHDAAGPHRGRRRIDGALGNEQILESVWGVDFNGDSRTVDTHIKRIRQKIAYDNAPWSIQTIYGIGYKFEVS